MQPGRVANPFVGDAVAARYADARPPLHRHAAALLAERIPRLDRALDVGCGTGLSTEPLVSVARLIIGADVSTAMLRRRAASAGTRYVACSAERLPFRNEAFDLATAASAIHWFASDAIGEIARVLKERGWFVVYDVGFRAEMVGVDAFARWMSGGFAPRYPAVPKNEFRPASIATAGFDLVWHEDLRLEFEMTSDALAAYLMTHSERIAAVREGRETAAEQRAYLAHALAPFFSEEPARPLVFGIEIEAFARTP
jgi:ubiquinone/menaquinone biosynthesis C-methylase UbiE